MRLTRSATRMESTMYPIELLKRGLRYSRLWTVAKTTSLCLYSDLLWIGLLWISGSRHEPATPPVLREDRRYRQPDAGGRYSPRRPAGAQSATRDAGGRGPPATARADQARRDADR